MPHTPEPSSQTPGVAAATRRVTSYDWEEVARRDLVLSELLGRPTEGRRAWTQRAAGCSVTQFHHLLEQEFLERYFSAPYRFPGRTQSTGYFPALSFGGAADEQKEYLRDWLYTKMYGRWFSQVYMVERFGVEPFERETGSASLAGALHAAGITNAREQLLVLYQVVSRNLENKGELRLPEVLMESQLPEQLKKVVAAELSEIKYALEAQQRQIEAESRCLISPEEELCGDEIDEARAYWLDSESYEPFSADLVERIRQAEVRSNAMVAQGAGIDGILIVSPYTTASSLIQHAGFNPETTPSRCIASCIQRAHCFDELLELFPNVGVFLERNGGSDHRILRAWMPYRRLITHALLEEGVLILYGDQLQRSSESRSDLAGNFKVDNRFRYRAFSSDDDPLNDREYFHLFLHDCAHFLLRGFNRPGVEFDLFRAAWIASEHYARWFSDYEIQQQVANSPYWKKWKPFVCLAELSEADRRQVIAAAGLSPNQDLSEYRHHTWYEILRDAGVIDELQGRSLLLYLNTNQEYEDHIELCRSFAETFGLAPEYRTSIWEQLRRNSQDEGYIGDAFDEVNGNSPGEVDCESPPRVKLRGNSALEALVRQVDRELTEYEVKEFLAPWTAREEKLETFLCPEAFGLRFQEFDEAHRAVVWEYLARCARVMAYLLDKQVPGSNS